MIVYENKGFWKLFAVKASVFPKAFVVAFPCALLASTLFILADAGYISYISTWSEPKRLMADNSPWSGFSVLVGFLVVFRTSQGYTRFWDGTTATHRMRVEWFDSCAAVIAFCKHSDADEAKVRNFQNTLIRLFSMLHAVALADIEDSSGNSLEATAFTFDLIDPGSIDDESLRTVQQCGAKVELVYQWIQQLIIENIRTGVLSVPPPVLTRSFQEIADGMAAFCDAIKISSIPFPFPYAQTCDALLLFHWLMVPVVVVQCVRTPWLAFVFSFIQVFFLWCLHYIAIEMENPFGDDANDLDLSRMQREMNSCLALLLHSSTAATPFLKVEAAELSLEWQREQMNVQESFCDVWKRLSDEDRSDCHAMDSTVEVPLSIRVCRLKTVESLGPILRGEKEKKSRHKMRRFQHQAQTPDDEQCANYFLYPSECSFSDVQLESFKVSACGTPLAEEAVSASGTPTSPSSQAGEGIAIMKGDLIRRGSIKGQGSSRRSSKSRNSSPRRSQSSGALEQTHEHPNAPHDNSGTAPSSRDEPILSTKGDGCPAHGGVGWWPGQWQESDAKVPEGNSLV